MSRVGSRSDVLRPVFTGLLALALQAPALADVVVNGTVIDGDHTARLAALLGSAPRDGRWWYDARTGAFGAEGQATAGFLPPGLALGGPLAANASGGGDGRYGGVFVNGRELHPRDVAALQATLGQVVPGRCWVDARGDFGIEGGPRLGNLVAIAGARGGANGPRGSRPSTCGSDASCANGHSWLGDGYFSDGATGCIVMDGEVSC